MGKSKSIRKDKYGKRKEETLMMIF